MEIALKNSLECGNHFSYLTPLGSPSLRSALCSPGCKQSIELSPSRAQRTDPHPRGLWVEGVNVEVRRP